MQAESSTAGTRPEDEVHRGDAVGRGDLPGAGELAQLGSSHPTASPAGAGCSEVGIPARDGFARRTVRCRIPLRSGPLHPFRVGNNNARGSRAPRQWPIDRGSAGPGEHQHDLLGSGPGHRPGTPGLDSDHVEFHQPGADVWTDRPRPFVTVGSVERQIRLSDDVADACPRLCRRVLYGSGFRCRSGHTSAPRIDVGAMTARVAATRSSICARMAGSVNSSCGCSD